MQDSRHCQGKRWDRRIEIGAVIRFHSVAALHRADRRLEYCATRIAKLFTWIQMRLFTDNAVACYFLNLSIGVRYDPVTAHQSCRHVAEIGDRYRIRKNVPSIVRFGLIIDVPAAAFNPPPKVISSVVRLRPLPADTHSIGDHDKLSQIVAEAFSQRRKMLRNALNAFATEEDLIAAGMDPQSRPECATIANYVALANLITDRLR